MVGRSIGGTDMPGYFGTEIQQRLQAEAEARADWIQVTPGACQSGRFMGCDDPDQLGWGVIDRALEQDGIVGFPMLPVEKVDRLVSRFAERGSRNGLLGCLYGRPHARA